MVPRFDLVFSYWLFAWYLLWEFGIASYNPKFGLLVGAVENLVHLGLYLYYRNSWSVILSFIVVNICIKAIPLWRLRDTAIVMDDVIFTCVLFLGWIVWANLNGISILALVDRGYRAIRDRKPRSNPFTPLHVLFATMFDNRI